MTICSLALVGALSLAPPSAGPEEPPRVFRSVLDERAPDDSTLAGWRAVSATTGEELEALARYRGYRLLDGDDEAVRPVELLWQVVLADGREVDIRERPAGSAAATGRESIGCIWFLREFHVSGLPQDVELRFPTGVWRAGESVRTGAPCSVEGMASGHCRWPEAEWPSEFPEGDMLVEMAVARAKSEVPVWEDPAVAPRDWSPSIASLLADGRSQACLILYTFPEEEDE